MSGILPGDVVTLCAGWAPMRVLSVRRACDGTGGDGLGLRCYWLDDGHIRFGWVSESSIRPVTLAELGYGSEDTVNTRNWMARTGLGDLLAERES